MTTTRDLLTRARDALCLTAYLPTTSALIADIDAALAAADEGWRPMADAPSDGTIILASGRNHDRTSGRHYGCVSWCEEYQVWEDCDGAPYGYLDYWQPLPNPPVQS